MSILQILQYPDPSLRRKSQAVSDVKSAKIKKIIDDMFDTLANTENCAALAATQLNIEQPPSIVVINSLDDNKGLFCIVNPQIISQEGCDTAEEGCMSVFPNHIRATIKRATKIRVRATDVAAKQIEFTAEDFLARCIQHECDHLNGVLYIDYLPKTKRALLEKEMLKHQLIDKTVCM